MRPSRVRLSRDAEKPADALLLANVPGQRLRVASHEVNGEAAEFVEVTYEPVDPDPRGFATQWTVRAVLRPGLELQTFSSHIRLFLEGGATPHIDLTYGSPLGGSS